eukprot:5462814-Pleurochrysis_carterae.AAC.4
MKLLMKARHLAKTPMRCMRRSWLSADLCTRARFERTKYSVPPPARSAIRSKICLHRGSSSEGRLVSSDAELTNTQHRVQMTPHLLMRAQMQGVR